MAEQNSHILDLRVGLRLGSLRTWTVVSSACIRSCDSSSAFMREWTFDSHLTCTFMTQLAMSCLDLGAHGPELGLHAVQRQAQGVLAVDDVGDQRRRGEGAGMGGLGCGALTITDFLSSPLAFAPQQSAHL